jgi:hypothetical protein
MVWYRRGDSREDTVIHHLSIAARDPQHVAGVLAEIMGGTVVPFRPNPGSYYALQLDQHGSGVEIHPAGTELQPTANDGAGFVRPSDQTNGYGAVHFALSVAADAAAVEAIARRENWPCYVCSRGPFHVVEVWVESETMIEVLPPDFAREYLEFFDPDKIATAMTTGPARTRNRPAA